MGSRLELIMNEVEFVEKHLGEYKRKGYELNVKYCPFCGSPKKHNQYKFFINTEKHTYICHRGSCGARGTFLDLAKHFNERVEYIVDIERNRFQNSNFKRKTYEKPKMKLEEVNGQADKYLKLRGFSLDTIKHFQIKKDSKGNIVFPYYDEKNIHRLNKIRIPRKFNKDKDKTKIWQEGNGKPILFNMNNTTYDKPLIVTEGEFDCMAVYEAGYKNVVSIPFGTGNVEWINECWDYLNEFKEIILFFDNDDAGENAIKEVSKKLGTYRVKLVNNETECKDANELLFKDKSKICTLIDNADYIPIEEINILANVKKKKRERILYGNKFLDYYLGGCGMGELVIWTGKRGGGKSSILNQTLIDTVDQKTKTFVYSGELSNEKVKQWFDRQIAGEKYLITEVDELTGREEYIVKPQVEKIINEWYSDYIFIYSDNGANDEDCLFEVMKYAYKRHDVKRFVIDNLKTIRFRNEKDFYRSQGLLVSRAKSFAKKYNVHIDLVVHPRKTSNQELADEDVGGSVDIIDLADNIITVGRITDEMIESAKDEDKLKIEGKQTFLTIKKNREYGDTGVKAYYKFNPVTKKIFGQGIENKKYSWEDLVLNEKFIVNDFEEVIQDEECPF